MPSGNGYGQADGGGGGCQYPGVAEALKDELHCRAFGEIRGAEIAGDGFGDKVEVLLANWSVEAPEFPHLFDLLFAEEIGRYDQDGVAAEAQDEEDDHGYDEHGHDLTAAFG